MFEFFKKIYHSQNPFGITDGFCNVMSNNRLPNDYVDWSIQHAGFTNLKYKGKNQRVAVLDSGVDSNHQDLIGKVTPLCFVPDLNDSYDYIGHGSFCIGQIVAQSNNNGVIGAACEATALSCKVLKGNADSLFSFETAIINAIKEAIIQKCDVISMSLGTSYKSPYIYEALQEAVQNGIIPIAAAGNEGLYGSPYKSYPASYENVISVASSNEKDLPSWFSTHGIGDIKEEQPEIAVSSLEYFWGCFPDNKYGKNIGTSMACPLVAAAALLWKEHKKITNTLPSGSNILKEFRIWLHAVAKDTNNNGWDNNIGYGVLKLSDKDFI